MEVKTGKKLGAGVIGTVYQGTYQKRPCIVKVEKFDGDMSTRGSYARQIHFDNDVARKMPDRFMILLGHGVMNSCDHKQPIEEQAPKDVKKSLQKKNKLKRCYVLYYAPILKYTLKDVRYKLSSAQHLIMLKQISSAILFMKKQGYIHGDLHDENIMCLTKSDWKIIDYGTCKHRKFITNKEDKSIARNDILSLCLFGGMNKLVDLYLLPNKIPLRDFNDVMKDLKKHKKQFTPYLPKKYTNHHLLTACILTDYKFYVETMGFGELYNKYKTVQKNKDFLLRLLKKHT